MGFTRPRLVLGSGSSGTGDVFVGDARLLSVSIETSTTSASRFTVSMSNADGFQAAIPVTSWSVVTTILNAGAYTIDPGARWARFERPNFGISATSNVTILLNRYIEHA